MKRVSSWTLGFVLALAGCAGTEAGTTGVADEGDLLQGGAALRRAQSGAVFTVGNEADGNHVYAFARAADGSLGQAVAHETGGLGSGDSLGSQSALVLSEDRRFLIAVDAGSSEARSRSTGQRSSWSIASPAVGCVRSA